MQIKRSSSNATGFTLVELLVVIAIIGIFIATLMPAIQQSRETARRIQCQNNLGKLALALTEYELASASFPSGTVAIEGPVSSRKDKAALHHNWIVALLPYLDEPGAAQRIDSKVSVYHEQHDPLRKLALNVLSCPSDRTETPEGISASNFAGVHHDTEAAIDESNNGILYLNSQVTKAEIKDGLQYTLLLGEKAASTNSLSWMSGTRATLRNAGHGLEADPAADDEKSASDPLFVGGFSSKHPGGVQFVYANGSAASLEIGIDPTLFSQLANRADGELIDPTDVQ